MTDVPFDGAGLLQRALFTALSALDIPQVVSAPPTTSQGGQEVVVYPFTLLGDDQVTDLGSKTRALERHDVAIHVCRQSSTILQVRADQAKIRAALDRQKIEIAGAEISRTRAPHMSTPILEDGATYVGSQSFSCFVQPA
jgi:hypothetical protein